MPLCTQTHAHLHKASSDKCNEINDQLILSGKVGRGINGKQIPCVTRALKNKLFKNKGYPFKKDTSAFISFQWFYVFGNLFLVEAEFLKMFKAMVDGLLMTKWVKDYFITV